MLNPFSMYNPFMNIYIYGNMLDKLLETQNYYDLEMSSNLPRVGGLIAFTKECHNDGGVNCTWVRWANFKFSFMSLRPSMD
jgi:hypothetical protein